MKKYSFFLILLLLLCGVGTVAAKKPQTVYIMGVSYSFSDSIVYFTEIQKMDSIVFSDEHKFLPDRQHYSYELSDFMAMSENMPNRMSALYYAKKITTLQKKAEKVKKKLIKKKKEVKYLGSKFSFTRPL